MTIVDDLNEQGRLTEVYGRLRLKLLDLSKKNRMLNYNLGTFSSLFELFWSGFAFFGGWSLIDCLAMIAIVSLVVAPLPAFKTAMNFAPLRWTASTSGISLHPVK